MANISHFTQTVNGVSTTYDIHDANAVPRSGGYVFSGTEFTKTSNDSYLLFGGGQGWGNGASISLYGKDSTSNAGTLLINASDNTNETLFFFRADGTIVESSNSGVKNVAMYEDVVPRSGGAVMTGKQFSRTVDNDELVFSGGTSWENSAALALHGKDLISKPGGIWMQPRKDISIQIMELLPDGTWTWSGTAVQLVSDQRLKQQISEIDDKLLDAWQDVDLVQFKYNDAVDAKKDKARLHTGYVVQQIDSACKSHGVDISEYGLYCHEEYPQETEEVEVEQADGTKTKETKVIREASEHYSLRYTEVYAVECMYLRRCIKQLTARIEQLEKGNNSK